MKEEISRRFPYFPFLCSSVAWMYSCEDRLKFEDSINLLRALKEAFSRRKTMNGGKERRKLRRGKKKKKQSEISFVSSKMIVRGKKDIKGTTRRRFRTGFYYDFTWLTHVLSPQNKLSNIIDLFRFILISIINP